jgi:hypothetical protein
MKTNNNNSVDDFDLDANSKLKYEIFFNIQRACIDDVEVRAHALVLSHDVGSERYMLRGFLWDSSLLTFRMEIPGCSRVLFGSVDLPVDNQYLGMRRAHLLVSGCRHRIEMFSSLDSDVGIQSIKLVDDADVDVVRATLARGISVHRVVRCESSEPAGA